MKIVLVALLPWLVSCTPSVHIQVLEPSSIVVPAHIQKVAFVDRSEAQGLGEGVLGVVEGLVTGEEAGQDHRGRASAGEALSEALTNSPRFEWVDLGQTNIESSLFTERLGWGAAKKACKRADCQGLVALEAFDSDSHIETSSEDYTEMQDGKEVHKKRWNAHVNQRVVTSWRFYDVENKRVLHQLVDHTTSANWERRGTSAQEAIDALPDLSNSVRGLGTQAGHHYGRLIAPTYITVSRAFFVRGHPSLKAQKNRVKAGAWNSAEADWVTLWESQASDKTRARAAHNLAIRQEIAGDLDAALSLAREAAVLWPKGRIGRYVYILEERQQKAAELIEQMAPAEAPEAEENSTSDTAPPLPPRDPAPEPPKETGPTMGAPPR